MDLIAFSDSEVYNDKSCSKTCLKNYETLKKQCDDLLVKLNQIEFIAATYKRGLATIEEQLVTYKKNEVLFSEEVAVLKREVACKEYEIGVLKSEFEKVKQEKEGIEFKIEKFDNASKSLDKLLGSQRTDNSKQGLGYHVVAPPHHIIYNRSTKLYLSYSGLKEFKEPEFKGYGPQDKQVSKDTSIFVESPLKVDKETIFLVDKKINCTRHQKKKVVTGNNYNRVDYDYYAKTSHPSTHRNMTPRAVLLKSGLKPLSIVRSIYTAHPKPTVHSARPMTHFSKQAQSTIQRPFYKKTTLTNRYCHQKINIVRPRVVNTARPYTSSVNTVRPRVVNTARPYTTSVNTVRGKGVNVVKTSACWVWKPTRPNGASLGNPQLNDKGFVDSGCSRHMTGNIAYLLNFKEFDGGHVTLGGGAYGERISGKV
ncbi:hypothetical protein Tco_0709975 [Tanacetum coccineum]